jgi:hypothetical protein
MALGTGPCSNTTRKIKRPHITGLRSTVLSDETDGRDEEGAENVCMSIRV